MTAMMTDIFAIMTILPPVLPLSLLLLLKVT